MEGLRGGLIKLVYRVGEGGCEARGQVRCLLIPASIRYVMRVD